MLLSSPTREGVTALQRKVLEVKGENPIKLVLTAEISVTKKVVYRVDYPLGALFYSLRFLLEVSCNISQSIIIY